MYEAEEVETECQRKTNTLPVWGNEKTMNLNSLLLTNVQSSHYFKVTLFGLKTFHEVVDEIYYNVGHMEPWEKGSRKAGQTGMCGGVRGVGTGGIVSTAFSCLYKMFTLRLTRRQVNSLLNHTDSPYIRAVGFLYLRYTQPPADLYGWFEPYLEDEEPVDLRAGGGEDNTIGQMCRRMLSKLDWFGTLLPRIPVPIEMKIQKLLKERFPVVHPACRERDVRPMSRESAAPDSQYRSRNRAPPPPPQQRPPSPARDIAEEIALEKERVRHERDGVSTVRADSDRDGSSSRHHHHRRDHHRDHNRDHNRDRHSDSRRDRPRHRSRERCRSRSRSTSRRRHRRSRSRHRRS